MSPFSSQDHVHVELSLASSLLSLNERRSSGAQLPLTVKPVVRSCSLVGKASSNKPKTRPSRSKRPSTRPDRRSDSTVAWSRSKPVLRQKPSTSNTPRPASGLRPRLREACSRLSRTFCDPASIRRGRADCGMTARRGPPLLADAGHPDMRPHGRTVRDTVPCSNTSPH
jgi:hypothetical protein